MWDDPPGCLYDTIPCSGCGACNPSPLDEYLNYKESIALQREQDQADQEGEQLDTGQVGRKEK